MDERPFTELDPDAVNEWVRKRFAAPIIASAGVSDCAVFESPGKFVIATTDFINASPIIFELGIGGMYDLGRLVVAANVADLLGSGVEAHSILLSAVFPRGSRATDFEELMTGVADMAATCGALVIGGDTKLGASLAVCATALGFAASTNSITPRHLARIDDEVWVSGALGGAACAAYSYRSSDLPQEWTRWASDTLRNPNLPLNQCRALRPLLAVHAGCDISDGLGADLTGLAISSGLGIELDATAIPVDPHVIIAANAVGVPPWLFAFASGGDFQIAVTAPRHKRDALAAAGFVRIGRMTGERDLNLRLSDGRFVALPNTGHRDARNMTFADEIEFLLTRITRDLE